MDRRMYRGNMGNNMGNNMGCNRNNAPYRPNDPVCGDVCGGYMPEEDFRKDICDRRDISDRKDACDRKDPCDRKDVCDRRDPCDRKDPCDREDFANELDRFPIGMCYVPWQCFRNLYDNEFTALCNGTIFKELDLKWYGGGCK